MTDVTKFYIQLRRPIGDDVGEVANGWFTFADGLVCLTDESGTPLKRGTSTLTARKSAKDAPVWSAVVLAGLDASQVAGRLLHQKVSSEKSGTDFHRTITYPRDSWV